MLALILKRLFWLVALLLALSYVCFAMIHLSKGSVVYAKSPQAVSAELKAQIESNLNLDKPLNEQYLSWLKGAMSGDFGNSLITGESVNEVLAERLPLTLTLGGLALLVLFFVSLFFAIISAIYKDKFIDKALNFISMGFLATPAFALCLLLILFFSVYLGVLPSSGVSDLGFEDDILNRAAHLVLPILALTLAHLGSYLRLYRTILLDSLNQSFIEAAFARGLSLRRIYFHLVLKHALPPILTYFAANSVAFLMSVYVVESVFAYGGLGNLVIESIIFKDYPMVLAVLLLSVVGVVVLNFLAELCANLLDTRKVYA